MMLLAGNLRNGTRLTDPYFVIWWMGDLTGVITTAILVPNQSKLPFLAFCVAYNLT